jgi:antitoxin CptB
MREMDILLQRFLERGYDTMSADERTDFERLLDLPDQDILAWLWGGEEELPGDEGLAAVVRLIRRAVARP